MTRVLVHGTTLDIAGRGFLLLGDSGVGKSDLALRLIGEGALLVADDRTWVSLRDGRLIAEAPETIAGKIEARGVGILVAARVSGTRLVLAVDLADVSPERMPEPRLWLAAGLGTAAGIRLIGLRPFEASATAKLRLALASVTLP